MKRRWVSFSVLSLAVVCPPLLGAQEQGGQRTPRFGGLGFGRDIDKPTLLGSEQVRNELKVTDEQKENLGELLSTYRKQVRAQMTGLRQLPREEREKKIIELRKEREKLLREVDKKLDAILSKEQSKRLNEIALQQRGLQALTGRDMIAALEMSEEQVSKIKGVLEVQRKELLEFVREDEGDRESRSEAMKKIRRTARTQVMATLNERQKKKFEALKGKPFELDRRSLRRGRQRRPRRG